MVLAIALKHKQSIESSAWMLTDLLYWNDCNRDPGVPSWTGSDAITSGKLFCDCHPSYDPLNHKSRGKSLEFGLLEVELWQTL